MIDDRLACGRRGLRTLPGTLLLGSTGARLFVDYLEDRAGFVGAIDLIHKLNIPMLFSVDADGAAPPQPSKVEWRPSHSTSRQAIGGLRLTERKFVSWDDCAVSLQRWENHGPTAQRLHLAIDADWMRRDGEAAAGTRPIPQHGFTLAMRIAPSDQRLWSGITLQPGETVEFTIVAALGLTETDAPEVWAARLQGWLDLPPAESLARQVREYEAWFDKAPRFSSSDPMLDRAYAYRWFLLRHNLAKPGFGAFDGTVFYEGRSHKMSKAPFAPAGWEFSKLIPLSSPMHLLEMRWYGDAAIGGEVLSALQATQGADGQLHARTVAETMHPYANFLGFAALQYGLARGVTTEFREALPMLKKQVRGERDHLATGGDSLPIQQDHRLTGKEYQPSYWYFHGFPDDPFDKATYTPLKRVDRAIYQYLNARGVAALCSLFEDGDADEFATIAARTADDVLDKQWDADTGFFYDLHHQTDEKAMVRNIVGFYPYWAGLTGEAHLDGFRAAMTAAHFITRAPFPSVSVDCPVYQPGGSWKGRFLKGRNGCMWDGPSWPYTNSIVLDAIGRVSQAHGHEFDQLFSDSLASYLRLHFRDADGRTPYLVEHYDSSSGEPISDEPDYNHSYLIDLIVRYVAGISLDASSRLRLDPLDIGLEHFELDNLNIRGCEIQIRYQRDGVDAGLRLLADGVEVACRADLGPLEWDGLPQISGSSAASSGSGSPRR